MTSKVLFTIASKTLVFVIVVLTAFIFPSEAPSNGQDKILQRQGYTPIGEIWKNAQKYQNRIITVSGQYRGWHGEGLKNPFITRSDWVIEDSTGAIYATGMSPATPGKKAGLGTEIIVKGQILLSKDNVPYIKAKEITFGKDSK